MKMQLPVKNLPSRKNSSSLASVRLLTVGLGLCCYGSVTYALNWAVTPTLQLRETYSDNVKLASPGNEKAGFVSELNPGIYATAQSGISTMSLNYRLQNLYNANGDNDFKTAHQLQYFANTILIPNKLFLNSSSSISQQNISTNNVVSDNISGSGNRTTVSTFNIAPQWLPRFGNYANGSVGLSFNTVTSSNNQPLTTTNPIYGFSDSASLAENIQLSSGSAFKRVRWSVGFNNTKHYRESGNDVSFRDVNTTLTTFLNKNFNVFATLGESNNSYQSTSDSNKNGLYYTFGGQWNPSKRYSITAGAGNNSYITLSILPMQRLSWITTFRDNAVGLNSGKTWQTALNYQTRRSQWSLSHDNDTTTAQNEALKSATNPDTLPVAIGATPSQTDAVIVRERWNLSTSFVTGKSTITASVFNENRSYEGYMFNENKNNELNIATKNIPTRNQKVRGISGSWNWLAGHKTSLYLRSQWQQTEGDDNSSASDYYDVSIGLSRLISNHLNANLELRHIEQNYDNQGVNKPLDLNNNTGNYQEHRVTASLFMRF